MKLFVKFVTAFLFAVLCLGCSDDESFAELYEADGSYAKNESDLKKYECNQDRKGIVVYLSEENAAMICDGDEWDDYEDWQKADESSSSDEEDGLEGVSSSSKKSSSSTRSSSSTKSNSSSSAGTVADTVLSYADLPDCDSSYRFKVIYVEALDRNMKCTSKNVWLEQNLVEIRDTLTYFPECNADWEGAEFYNRKERGSFTCNEGEWVESYKWFLGERGDGSSADIWDSTLLDHEITSVIKDARDSVLEKCTDEKEGKFVRDTSIGFSKNGYYQCSEGHWFVVPDSVADTVGLESLGEGSFAIARFSKDTVWSRPNLPTACLVSGKPKSIYYVYDGGAWRRASYIEMCQLHPCLKANEGDIYEMLGFRFRCENSAWVQDSLFDYDKEDVFNKNYEYGVLTDDRDGKKYKTVVIDGKKWMAENLNYYDGSRSMYIQSRCYVKDGDDCGIGGRNYSWSALMDLDTVYADTTVPDTLINHPHRGICPSGWHVPDTSEWKALLNGNSAASLASDAGWILSWGSVAEGPLNTTGFSGLPLDFGGTSSTAKKWSFYIQTAHAEFCSASQLDYRRAYTANFFLGRTFVSNLAKRSGCFVRCVQDGE